MKILDIDEREFLSSCPWKKMSLYFCNKLKNLNKKRKEKNIPKENVRREKIRSNEKHPRVDNVRLLSLTIYNGVCAVDGEKTLDRGVKKKGIQYSRVHLTRFFIQRFIY